MDLIQIVRMRACSACLCVGIVSIVVLFTPGKKTPAFLPDIFFLLLQTRDDFLGQVDIPINNTYVNVSDLIIITLKSFSTNLPAFMGNENRLY